MCYTNFPGLYTLAALAQRASEGVSPGGDVGSTRCLRNERPRQCRSIFALPGARAQPRSARFPSIGVSLRWCKTCLPRGVNGHWAKRLVRLERRTSVPPLAVAVMRAVSLAIVALAAALAHFVAGKRPSPCSAAALGTRICAAQRSRCSLADAVLLIDTSQSIPPGEYKRVSYSSQTSSARSALPPRQPRSCRCAVAALLARLGE